MLTAHDYPSARFIESAASSTPTSSPVGGAPQSHPQRGIDVCLVGDSLAMVACGYPSTTSLTLPELLFHCQSVARGCTSSLLVADMPFGTALPSLAHGVEAAIAIVQQGNMDGVKIEGGAEIIDLVHRLTSVGIPVMGHVGLTPQRQAALSGYRVQGKTAEGALRVWRDAKALQDAGAFAIVLEAVPARLGEFISSRLEIPTIGIGAGGGCDGQVLVQLDMMGVRTLDKGPRFLKRYAALEEVATGAVAAYVEDVRTGAFPEAKHSYGMDEAEWEDFEKRVVLEGIEQE